MRVLANLLVALMLLAVPASAMMEDDSGDAMGNLAGSPVEPLRPAPAVDLIGLTIEETDQALLFHLDVAGLQQDDADTFLDGSEYHIWFSMGEIRYVIMIVRDVEFLGSSYAWGYLMIEETNDDRTYLSIVDWLWIDQKIGEGRLSAEVYRDVLVDDTGAPARLGHQLSDFVVEAKSANFGTFRFNDMSGASYQVADRMPDEGFGPTYDVVFGIVQDGDARLSSEAPFRLSNGGATTLVYEVDAHNAGDRQSFRLALESVPEDWVVELPYHRIILDEGEHATFPVLVTTPSGHQHGGAEAFLLTMTGESDASHVGRVELGIKYADIPQPAGHHPRLWLHSTVPSGGFLGPLDDVVGTFRFNDDGLYMNALEDDEADQQIPIPGAGSYLPGLGGDFWWFVPLQPFLEIGLDFDTSQTGELSVPIQFDYIAQDAVLEGRIYVYSSEIRDSLVVANVLPTAPASWGPGEQEFEATIEITDDADFIPYGDEMFMWMELRLDGQFIGPGLVGPNNNPMIMPGGSLELPLNEYRDPVQTFYDAVRSLEFGTDYLERQVNPAETVIFETHLRNSDDEPQTVELNLTGVNVAWSQIVGATSFELAPGEERDIAIAVKVPADIEDGALADLVLQAINADDPNRRALIDLIALVDAEADHPDQSDELDALAKSLSDEKESPGFEIAAVLLGLLAIVLVLRRD